MNNNETVLSALLFRVLSNEIRLRIILSLADGGKSVGEICSETEVEQARVSHELHCLTVCGLVDFRREGKKVIYLLNKDTVLPILAAADRHVGKFGTRIGSCEMVSEAKRVKIDYAQL